MSRTYRKMKLGNWNKSEIAYINQHMRRFTGSVRIRNRKSKEQIEAEKIQAVKDRENWYLKYRSNYITIDDKIVWAPTLYVHKYVYKDVYQSREDRIKELRQKYATFSRDGRFNESSRSTGFKKKAARVVRRENQRFCRKIMMGAEYDHTPYPDHHLGDPYVWDFW